MEPRIVKVQPRSLAGRLRYTDNIDGERDKCRLAESILEAKMRPIVEKAMHDLFVYGTAVIPTRWRDGA